MHLFKRKSFGSNYRSTGSDRLPIPLYVCKLWAMHVCFAVEIFHHLKAGASIGKTSRNNGLSILSTSFAHLYQVKSNLHFCLPFYVSFSLHPLPYVQMPAPLLNLFDIATHTLVQAFFFLSVECFDCPAFSPCLMTPY